MSDSDCTSPLKLQSYLASPDAVLYDPDVVWRYGKAPDYTATRKVWAETKTMSHANGSLPELVEHLVKNWEIEASFKPRLADWRTIDPNVYSFAVNGSEPQSLMHMLNVGTYNALIPPNEFYCPAHSDFAASHKTFKRMMPTFAWEVLEVFSGPPTVVFKWRHWGEMKNDYVGINNKGDKVVVKAHGGPIELFGVTVAQVDDAVRIQKLEVWFDPQGLFRQIAPVGVNDQPQSMAKQDETQQLSEDFSRVGTVASDQVASQSAEEPETMTNSFDGAFESNEKASAVNCMAALVPGELQVSTPSTTPSELGCPFSTHGASEHRGMLESQTVATSEESMETTPLPSPKVTLPLRELSGDTVAECSDLPSTSTQAHETPGGSVKTKEDAAGYAKIEHPEEYHPSPATDPGHGSNQLLCLDSSKPFEEEAENSLRRDCIQLSNTANEVDIDSQTNDETPMAREMEANDGHGVYSMAPDSGEAVALPDLNEREDSINTATSFSQQEQHDHTHASKPPSEHITFSVDEILDILQGAFHEIDFSFEVGADSTKGVFVGTPRTLSSGQATLVAERSVSPDHE